MAPATFQRKDGQSAVFKQPESESARASALKAMLSCPTQSIHTTEKARDIKEIQKLLPSLVDDNVYHCGYHSRSSFGAASYFIRSDQGNILVDSPRWSAPLVKQLEDMGGVNWMFLTHKDDVADHAKYHEHFGCERILDELELNSRIPSAEICLRGPDDHRLSDDVTFIQTPGHTRGHRVMLYKNKFLFSGDHVAWSHTRHHLVAFPDACWYSFAEQAKSMRKLLDYSFSHILPGHGAPYRAPDAATMREQVARCADWMLHWQDEPMPSHGVENWY